MVANQVPHCEALVSRGRDPRNYPCERPGKHVRLGHRVCWQHARAVDKWEAEGRANSMVQFWWHWILDPVQLKEEEGDTPNT
jgi:hypothetical protein